MKLFLSKRKLSARIFRQWLNYRLMAIATIGLFCFTILPSCLSVEGNSATTTNSTVEVKQVVYPEDGMVNIRDYGVKGDGKTDDTELIRLAVEDNIMTHKTLYFPEGTYLVSKTIEWKREDGKFGAFLTWQGAGVDKTTIKLVNKAENFQDSENPKAIAITGSIGIEDGRGPRAHNNYIFDMTFDVGKNNPGAIGIDFNASNTGAVENVAIVSQDGKGTIGLNLTREVGPCLIKNVSVKGFDVGIKVASALYGITFEKIHLEDQNTVGFLNKDNVVAIRQLSSVNTVPAFQNIGDWKGPAVLIDSQLQGGTPETVAIENSSRLFVRNLNTEGYKAAIKNEENLIDDSQIEEFLSSSAIALLYDSETSLNLPIEETPEFVNNDLNNWASVETYGAMGGDKLDDSEAIQKAIDSGKSTIYFPLGSYIISKPIIVRGNIRRIVGFHSSFVGDNKTQAIIRFENDRHPVIFERFNCYKKCTVENAASQPVVIRHSISPLFESTSPTATWFMEDVVTSKFNLNKGQKLYARQFNCESPPPEPLIQNDGGLVWLLGYKTEFGNTVATTINDGKTEILGGLFYPSQGVKDPEIPVLINENSSVSAIYREIAFGSNYKVQIKEVRQGKSAILMREELGKGKMVAVPLYIGY